jgi:hypothetical protein
MNCTLKRKLNREDSGRVLKDMLLFVAFLFLIALTIAISFRMPLDCDPHCAEVSE